MQVGYVEKKELMVGKEEKKTYLQMHVKIPFHSSEKFSLKKYTGDQENAPYYNIYMHKPKGYNCRQARVGSVWLREANGVKYFSGYIENPSVDGGKMYIALFKPKALFEGEEVTWELDVVWSPPQVKQDDDVEEKTEEKSAPEVVYEDMDEEIPF